jgi:hypothetical protein
VIPPFNEHGYLPPGIHPATLDEVESRFGYNEFFATDRNAIGKGMVTIVS